MKLYLAYGLMGLVVIALTTLIALHDVPASIVQTLIGVLVGGGGAHLIGNIFGNNTSVHVHLPDSVATTQEPKAP